MSVRVEISCGELFDKISILELKRDHARDAGQRGNVETELAVLVAVRDAETAPGTELDRIVAELRSVNAALWTVEDDLRDCERRGDFGAGFVSLARSVYRLNDRRAALKREIDILLGSGIVEEKLYRRD